MKTRLSKAIEGGLDINCSSITPDGKGGHTASIESWQLAMQYAILQELTKLNELLHCSNFVKIPHTLREIKGRLRPRERSRKKAVRS